LTTRYLSRLHRNTTALVLLAGAAFISCRRQTAPVPPAPAVAQWPHDEHCWWTSIHTALPVDTVGGRFARAFSSVGLTGIVSQRIGDTVLVRGGPTELLDAKGRALYASRAVAYQLGDSTRFRWYLSVAPRADGAGSVDSSNRGDRSIPFCGQIGKAVAISGMMTRDPTADDSIAVWDRVP
jgi:hypothetical protein